ncbi:MAG: hypothetical protein JXP72_01900 [Coriobacteriia bacterium]|nr:hypothetical protein [Coriobacteriia bacterium]
MTETAAPITVEDLRRKADHIRDLAEIEARHVVADRGARIVAIGAVAVLAAVSLAFYLGSRRA